MARGRRINIIYSDNGSGLSRDAFVLRDALERAGHWVWLTPRAPRQFPLALNYAPELARRMLRDGTQHVVKACARRTRLWDINIFLEQVVPEYLECARINSFFPNPEWLVQHDRRLLKDIDLLLVKTEHAMAVLGGESKKSAYVGFTTADRRDSTIAATKDAALHVCGWNPHKGTQAVLGAWMQHPDWPQLTVVSQLDEPGPASDNVTRVTSRITDVRLRRLQNECVVHVCPSEVEGFGHTLMEALSCGAVLITTGAPPMDELITPEEGFLVPPVSTTPMRAGIRYMVDQQHLAEIIARVWTMESAVIARVRRAARARYERNRALFHQRLAGAIQGI